MAYHPFLICFSHGITDWTQMNTRCQYTCWNNQDVQLYTFIYIYIYIYIHIYIWCCHAYLMILSHVSQHLMYTAVSLIRARCSTLLELGVTRLHSWNSLECIEQLKQLSYRLWLRWARFRKEATNTVPRTYRWLHIASCFSEQSQLFLASSDIQSLRIPPFDSAATTRKI